MGKPRWNLGRMSVVAAWLQANGLTIRLNAVGRGYVTPETRLDLPASEGVIIIEIDECEYRRRVEIVKDCNRDDYMIPVKNLEDWVQDA